MGKPGVLQTTGSQRVRRDQCLNGNHGLACAQAASQTVLTRVLPVQRRGLPRQELSGRAPPASLRV